MCDIGDAEAIDPVCWPKRFRDALEGKSVDPTTLLDAPLRSRASEAINKAVEGICAAALNLRASYKNADDLDSLLTEASGPRAAENPGAAKGSKPSASPGMRLRSGRLVKAEGGAGGGSKPGSSPASHHDAAGSSSPVPAVPEDAAESDQSEEEVEEEEEEDADGSAN